MAPWKSAREPSSEGGSGGSLVSAFGWVSGGVLQKLTGELSECASTTAGGDKGARVGTGEAM